MQNYFAIIGNNLSLALRELELVHPKNVNIVDNMRLDKSGKQDYHIVFFDTDDENGLKSIASIVKRGRMIKSVDFEKYIDGKRILGTSDQSVGLTWKRKYAFKRFKKIDLLHTDREVKEKGIEVVLFPDKNIGIVLGYQNIPLYELVDFGKPARSMQVGMMPAKLTHCLLNIGLSCCGAGNLEGQLVIYDPFCGTATTGLISNYFGLNFIGSDLKIGLTEKNIEWRQHNHKFDKQNAVNQLPVLGTFTQDISKPIIENQRTQILKEKRTLIITEGWLGPVVKASTDEDQIFEYQRRVKNLYLQFLTTISNFYGKKNLPVMIFTIPIYISLGADQLTVEDEIKQLGTKLGRVVKSIEELYQRQGQKVARKVMILSL